jgi:CDP-paratose 2-epimerase
LRILLIGNEGYVGVGLQKYFEDQSHNVVGWTRQQDLFSLQSSFFLQNQIDLVVNAAAVMSRSTSVYQSGGLDEKVNFFGVRHLVTELKNSEVPLVHISTKDVYGSVYTDKDTQDEGTRLMPRRAIDDLQPLNPSTLYAMTKLMGEFALTEYPKFNIIRLTSGYTDFSHRRGNWMTAFVQKVLAGETLSLTGSGKQVRDPLHASDLGRLILKMVETNKWGHKVNAGGGILNAISILEFAKLISANASIDFQGIGDHGFISSNRLAKEIFGWEPKINVRDKVNVLIKNIQEKIER